MCTNLPDPGFQMSQNDPLPAASSNNALRAEDSPCINNQMSTSSTSNIQDPISPNTVAWLKSGSTRLIKERNNKAAQRSRKRKKQDVERLQQQVTESQQQVTESQQQVAQSQQQVAQSQQQVMQSQQQVAHSRQQVAQLQREITELRDVIQRKNYLSEYHPTTRPSQSSVRLPSLDYVMLETEYRDTIDSLYRTQPNALNQDRRIE